MSLDPEQANSRYRTQFEHMTPIFPQEQIILESSGRRTLYTDG